MSAEFESFRGQRNWVPDRPKHPDADHGASPAAVDILHADGVSHMDQNEIAILVATRGLELLPASPDYPSVISGEPGLVYRTNETYLALSREEMERLVLRSLSPEEFTAICDAVGCIWELHDDFYDPETGEALQPKDDMSFG